MPKNKQQLLGDNFDCDKIAEDLLKNLEKTREQLIGNFDSDKLNYYKKAIEKIRKSLPFLTIELNKLGQELEALATETGKNVAEIRELESNLLKEIKKTYESDLEYNQLIDERAECVSSKEKCKNVSIQAENLSNKRDTLYIYQMVSCSPIEFGSGFDEVININAPKAKEQMQSLDHEIEVIDKKISDWGQERIALNEIIEKLNQEILQKNHSFRGALTQLTSQAAAAELAINEMLTLEYISKQNSIYAAAVRGDETGIINFLPSANSLNTPDKYNHKPIYYAFRCGHAALATTLMDHTVLIKQDVEEILAALPTHDKIQHSLLVAIIKNKNTYDHLWNDKELIGKNIKNIFQDHFSPLVFNSFSFLSNEVKRVLSFNPHRQHLKLAEDIYSFFNVLEQDMLADLSTAKVFIMSKLKAYHRDYPNDLFNPYVRRLFYVQNKLDAMELQQEFKMALNNSSFFNSMNEKESNAQSFAMTPYNY
ncbi:MAG: hypothetical protein J0I93_07890 [Legionella sp.]|nr:hypothetical protein [Legionella sp.]